MRPVSFGSRWNQPGDLIGRGGLSADAYLSADQLTAEQALIDRSWQLACYESDLPATGSYLAAACGSEPIAVVRQPDGDVKAMSAVCLHRGGPVAVGCGQAPSLRCAYHGWRYDLSGRLIEQPQHLAETTAWTLPAFGALTVPPFVFVRVAGDAPPPEGLARLEAALGANGHPRELRRTRRTYLVEANWKLVVENFLECVHCPFVHPTTVARRLDLDNYDFDIADDHIRYDVRSAGDAGTRQIFALYPNIAVGLLPGLLVTFHARPTGVSSTQVVRDFVVMEGDDVPDEEQMHATIGYFDEIMGEDARLVEAVQGNMQSRVYRPGGYLPGEAPVSWFHGRLTSDLAAFNATASGEAACGPTQGRSTGSVSRPSPPPTSLRGGS